MINIANTDVPRDVFRIIGQYSIGQSVNRYRKFSAVCKGFRAVCGGDFTKEKFLKLKTVLETTYKLDPEEIQQIIGNEPAISKLCRLTNRLKAASNVLADTSEAEQAPAAKRQKVSNTNAYIPTTLLDSPAEDAEKLKALYASNNDFSNELKSRFLGAFHQATQDDNLIQSKLILSHKVIGKIDKRQKESYIRKIKFAAAHGNKCIIRDVLASNIYSHFKRARPRNRSMYFKVVRSEFAKAASIALMHGHLDILQMLLDTKEIVSLGELLYMAASKNQLEAIKIILSSHWGSSINSYGERDLTRVMMTLAETGNLDALNAILTSWVGSVLPTYMIKVAFDAAEICGHRAISRALRDHIRNLY